jgi:DNA-binding XRE family transcriptional regulator
MNNNEYKNKIRTNFRLLCEMYKLTPFALAKKTGVSKQTIYSWYNEGKLPNIETITIIKEFFKTSYDFLIEGIDESRITISVGNHQSIVPYHPDKSIISPVVSMAAWKDVGKLVFKGRDIPQPVNREISPIACHDDWFGLYCTGSEMVSFDGSFSFVEETILIFNPFETPYYCSYVVARLPKDPCAIFRRVTFADNQFWLSPGDKSYPSYKITKAVKIIAVLECAYVKNVNRKINMRDNRKYQELDKRLAIALKS